jgi:mannose-6-phosphate isomerase-like protein (cupin superfamily)
MADHGSMPTTTLTFDRSTALHLATDLTASVISVDEAFWEHRADHPEMADGRVLLVVDCEETWGRWERHPDGDELVYAVSGEVTFHLEDADGSRRMDLRGGEGGLVPKGAWHRAEIHQPARLLFVTPTPARTEHRPR